MRKEVAGETEHHLIPPIDCRTQQLANQFIQHKLWGRFLLRYNPLALIKDGGQTHFHANGRMLTASVHLQYIHLLDRDTSLILEVYLNLCPDGEKTAPSFTNKAFLKQCTLYFTAT